jgi:hypothetical protein
MDVIEPFPVREFPQAASRCKTLGRAEDARSGPARPFRTLAASHDTT